jgi:hypothetical protein
MTIIIILTHHTISDVNYNNCSKIIIVISKIMNIKYFKLLLILLFKVRLT